MFKKILPSMGALAAVVAAFVIGYMIVTVAIGLMYGMLCTETFGDGFMVAARFPATVAFSMIVGVIALIMAGDSIEL